MMHSIKKAVGLTHDIPEPDRYLEGKSRLANIRSSLGRAVNRVDGVNSSWSHVVRDATSFHRGLYDDYPYSDNTKGILKGGEAKMRELDTTFKTETTTGRHHHDSLKGVKSYLSEIDALETDYAQVETSKKDYEKYDTKKESLEKKHKVGEKVAHTASALQDSRTAYNQGLKNTMMKINTLSSKAPEMFETVHSEYWKRQSRMMGMVESHFGPSLKTHGGYTSTTRGLTSEITDKTSKMSLHSGTTKTGAEEVVVVPVIKKVPVVKEVPEVIEKKVIVEKKVPVIKEVPVVKEVEVIKEVPVVKEKKVFVEKRVPVVKEVPYVVEKKVPVIKKVPVEQIKEVPVTVEKIVPVVKKVVVEKKVPVVKEVPYEVEKKVALQEEVPVEVEKAIPIAKAAVVKTKVTTTSKSSTGTAPITDPNTGI